MCEGGEVNFLAGKKGGGGNDCLARQKGGASIFWRNILEIHHPPTPPGVHIIIAPPLIWFYIPKIFMLYNCLGCFVGLVYLDMA